MQQTMLIKTEAAANHNKFYELTLDASQNVTARYGRVSGAHSATTGGQRRKVGVGERVYQRQIAAKQRKGYRVVPRVGDSGSNVAGRDVLREAGRRTLAGEDPVLTDLVDLLVLINAHDIASASGGQITVSRTGGVSTSLGPISATAIDRARGLLADIERGGVTDRLSLLDEYLMLVPQPVPRQRGWGETFFGEFTTFRRQSDLLDQLEASVRFADATDTTETDTDDYADMFRYRLALLDDDEAFTKINKEFSATANDRHSTARSTLRRVYVLTDTQRDSEVDAMLAGVGNVRSMWHGSRASNVLSIMASGMVIPSPGAGHTTGRMFGDGLYFSEQSTKSLNYGRGGQWSRGVDQRHFMFRAEVAMGWECRPNLHNVRGGAECNKVLAGKSKDPKTGRRFDSINVKAGTSGVLNHEAIVPRPDQVRLAYLCEFG